MLAAKDTINISNDDLLKKDFDSDAPSEKLIGDITQLPTADGILYIGLTFDCFDNAYVGLAMDDNMRSPLVERSLSMAVSNKDVKGSIVHRDRGSQYTINDFKPRVVEPSCLAYAILAPLALFLVDLHKASLPQNMR